MSEWAKLKAQDGHELSAYVARPEGTARGGICVLQEIFGVNAHIRSVVDGYAKEGYVAIAPALFDRFETGVELRYEGPDMQRAFGLYQKLAPEAAILDIGAAFAAVRNEGAGAGVVGFCYGGLMSWLSATRGSAHGFEPRACVGYYAGGIGSVAAEQPSCPVMLHFGADDTHIGQDHVEAVRHAHPEVEIFVYPGAEHGFNCDARASYNPEASASARKRTLDFFARHIG